MSILVCGVDRSADWWAFLCIQHPAWSSELMPTLFMFIYYWTIHTWAWLHIGHCSHVKRHYFQRDAFLWGSLQGYSCLNTAYTKYPSTALLWHYFFKHLPFLNSQQQCTHKNIRLTKSLWIFNTWSYDFSNPTSTALSKKHKRGPKRRFTRRFSVGEFQIFLEAVVSSFNVIASGGFNPLKLVPC